MRPVVDIHIMHFPKGALAADHHPWSFDFSHIVVAGDAARRHNRNIARGLFLLRDVEASLQNAEFIKARYSPSLRHWANSGFLLRFAEKAFGEKSVQECLF